MSKKPESRHVVPHPDGWAVKKPGASRASAVERTQADAIGRGRDILRGAGGGELRVHRPNGQIRGADTVPPGNDPYPPAG